MRAELFFTTEKFPDLKELILSHFERDEEFQALCMDYFLCTRSLDNCESDLRKYQQRCKEYTELKRVIEEKMLNYINTGKSPIDLS